MMRSEWKLALFAAVGATAKDWHLPYFLAPNVSVHRYIEANRAWVYPTFYDLGVFPPSGNWSDWAWIYEKLFYDPPMYNPVSRKHHI